MAMSEYKGVCALIVNKISTEESQIMSISQLIAYSINQTPTDYQMSVLTYHTPCPTNNLYQMTTFICYIYIKR